MLTSTFNKRNELTYLPNSDTLQAEFLIKHSAWLYPSSVTHVSDHKLPCDLVQVHGGNGKHPMLLEKAI